MSNTNWQRAAFLEDDPHTDKVASEVSHPIGQEVSRVTDLPLLGFRHRYKLKSISQDLPLLIYKV